MLLTPDPVPGEDPKDVIRASEIWDATTDLTCDCGWTLIDCFEYSTCACVRKSVQRLASQDTDESFTAKP